MKTPGIKTVVRIVPVVCITLVIVGYTYFKLQPYRDGPIVTVSSPESGITVYEPSLTISGTTERVSSIQLNGRKIFIDKESVFSENILLFPGYNLITIDATDRFDKHIEKRIEIIYKEDVHLSARDH